MTRGLRRAVWDCAVLCIGCAVGCVWAQSGTAAPTADAGPEAVKSLLKHYAINPLAKDPQTHQPLRMDGNWLVGKTQPAACQKTTQTCVEIFYIVPSQQAKCEWAIALNSDGTDGTVLAENKEAETYLVRVLMGEEAKPFVQSRSKPAYIPLAQALHAGGDEVVRVQVGTSGDVEDAHIVSGTPVLQPVSLDAARKWKFKPMMVGDHAVEYQVQMVFSFYIDTIGVKMTP